jgi:hypothetical protein
VVSFPLAFLPITYVAIHIIVREGTWSHLVGHMSTREEILDSKMDASGAETREVNI